MTTDKNLAAVLKELRKPLPRRPRTQRTVDLVKALGDRQFVLAVDCSGSMKGDVRLPALTSLSIRLNRCPDAILAVSFETKLYARVEDPTDIVAVGETMPADGPTNLEMLAHYMREHYDHDTIVVFLSDGQMDFSVQFEQDLFVFSTNADDAPPLPYNPYAPWFKRSFATEKLKI